jgi:hypothetical protein
LQIADGVSPAIIAIRERWAASRKLKAVGQFRLAY